MSLLVEFMSSNEADEIYRKLLKLYEEAGYVNPKAVLNEDINEQMKKGKTRDEAILHLNEHPEDREISESERKGENERLESKRKEKSKEAKDQQIAVEQVKKKIADLTVLFSKNEISEEAYKTAVRTLEESVGGLKSKEDTSISPSSTLSRKEYRHPAEPPSYYDKPSSAWYLVPLFFGLIGGLIGYVGTKDRDKDMANNLLIFGIIWSIVLWLILWAWITSLS
jgi:hypothetical protein